VSAVLGSAGRAGADTPPGPCTIKEPHVTKKAIGKTPEGIEVDQYTLTNAANNLRVTLMTYGATLTSVCVPDRAGKMENVILTQDSLEGFLNGVPYFGATVGRYANRIARGKFKLDGHEYTLAVNNGPNHLHGGLKGFDKVVWKAEPINRKDSVGVKFS
jgi:aldose 1-epimerase